MATVGELLAEDADSAFDELSPSTSSLASNQYLFEKRLGRTYHSFKADQNYSLPNDEKELDRMDMQFWAIHEIMGQYFFSPIGDNPQNILDVGTGTGIWAIDVGDAYPSAQVRGTDLSPIQPTWVPPNVLFELHDCLQYPWEYHQKFDLIHTQVMNALVIRNWDEFYAEAYQNLRPGGWVESHEVSLMAQSDDNSIPENGGMMTWLRLMDIGLGGSQTSGEILEESMRKAGFVNIQIKAFKLVMGPWDPKYRNAGLLSMTATCENMEGLSNVVFREILGKTGEEMQEHITQAGREFRTKSIHAWLPLYAVFGQRPESE